jgi:hypothetical protein
MDVLVCRKILHPRPEATDEHCSVWMKLSFRYAQLFSLPYRMERDSVYAGMEKKLEYALWLFGSYVADLESQEIVRILKQLIPDQIKMALPLISENYAAAEYHFHQNDSAQTIVHLETTLSLIHGILDGLVDALAV